MRAAQLIRRARLRAGLAQRELAERLDTQQPVVARWESGARAPSFDSVARAVAACGLRMNIELSPADPGEDALLLEWLRLTPKERLGRNAQMLATEEWARRARPVGGSSARR